MKKKTLGILAVAFCVLLVVSMVSAVPYWNKSGNYFRQFQGGKEVKIPVEVQKVLEEKGFSVEEILEGEDEAVEPVIEESEATIYPRPYPRKRWFVVWTEDSEEQWIGFGWIKRSFFKGQDLDGEEFYGMVEGKKIFGHYKGQPIIGKFHSYRRSFTAWIDGKLRHGHYYVSPPHHYPIVKPLPEPIPEPVLHKIPYNDFPIEEIEI